MCPKKLFLFLSFRETLGYDLFSEARRPFRGLGKYRFSKAFEDFFVEPTKWVQWSDEWHNEHFAAFMNAQPKAFGYEKPGDAGQKPWNPRKSKIAYHVTRGNKVFR